MINMIDTREVRTDLEGLASRLDRSDKKAAQRLRNLNSAVGGGSNADVWAATDIRQIIEPEQIVNRFKNRRATNGIIIFLEGVRNFLIFAPLVVTWFGISNAVTAYSDLIGTDTGGNTIQLPFIYLWQRGFNGHLASWETLGTLATIDVVLLSIILILTFIIFIANDIFKTQREREAEDLREDLIHTLARASLCLAKSNRQQPGTVINDFNSSMKRFDEILRQLLSQMKDIADRQGNERQFFDAFMRSLETSMRNIASIVGDLQRANTAMKESIDKLVEPSTKIAGKMDELSKKASDTIKLFQDQIDAQGALLKSQDEWGTKLQDALTGLKDATQDVANMATTINDFTQKQKDLVAAIKTEREAQARISGEIQLSAKHMKSYYEELDKATVRMSQFVKYMDDVSRRFAGMPAGQSQNGKNVGA